MLKALTVSEAKPKLGSLLDKAGNGQSVYLRRKERLYRIELVAEIEPIPARPFGYFNIEGDDQWSHSPTPPVLALPPSNDTRTPVGHSPLQNPPAGH